MTLCGWKVSDVAVNIEKYVMKIKMMWKDDKAVVVLNNHRFVFISMTNYTSLSNVYELTRMSNVCPGLY